MLAYRVQLVDGAQGQNPRRAVSRRGFLCGMRVHSRLSIAFKWANGLLVAAACPPSALLALTPV